MDHIANIFEDLINCTNEVREILKGYPMLHYAFSLMRCLILYELGKYISIEAAYIQSLIFVTVFFLSTRSFFRAIRVLLAQCFWILTAQILRYHFLSNAVMSMIMTLNEDIESVLNGILVTHVSHLIFQYDPEYQDLLCIRITAVFVMTWYFACCSKNFIDLVFYGLICYSYYAFYWNLIVTGTVQIINPVYQRGVMCLVLFCWFLLVLLNNKEFQVYDIGRRN